MEIHRLQSAGDHFFEEAFDLYKASFPQHEQRRVEQQAALMPNPLYHFDIHVEDDLLVGILLHWELTGCAYIEHFAIHPAIRGRALGSKCLETFCRRCPLVVLEIDPPVDAVSERREVFYQRLGFLSNGYAHTHPAYRARLAPHPLVVMSYPRQLTPSEYRLFREELDGTVMRDLAR